MVFKIDMELKWNKKKIPHASLAWGIGCIEGVTKLFIQDGTNI